MAYVFDDQIIGISRGRVDFDMLIYRLATDPSVPHADWDALRSNPLYMDVFTSFGHGAQPLNKALLSLTPTRVGVKVIDIAVVACFFRKNFFGKPTKSNMEKFLTDNRTFMSAFLGPEPLSIWKFIKDLRIILRDFENHGILQSINVGGGLTYVAWLSTAAYKLCATALPLDWISLAIFQVFDDLQSGTTHSSLPPLNYKVFPSSPEAAVVALGPSPVEISCLTWVGTGPLAAALLQSSMYSADAYRAALANWGLRGFAPGDLNVYFEPDSNQVDNATRMSWRQASFQVESFGHDGSITLTRPDGFDNDDTSAKLQLCYQAQAVFFGNGVVFRNDILADGNCTFVTSAMALAFFSKLPSNLNIAGPAHIAWIQRFDAWRPDANVCRQAFVEFMPRLQSLLPASPFGTEQYRATLEELPGVLNYLATNTHLTSTRELPAIDMAQLFAASFQVLVPFIQIAVPNLENTSGPIRATANLIYLPNRDLHGEEVAQTYIDRGAFAPFAFVQYVYYAQDQQKAHTSLAYFPVTPPIVPNGE